jgi:5-methylcytosine-specific restriction endonuclease McrA
MTEFDSDDWNTEEHTSVDELELGDCDYYFGMSETALEFYADDERPWSEVQDEIMQAKARAERSPDLGRTGSQGRTVATRIALHNMRGDAGGTLTEEEWVALRLAFGNACAYCGEASVRPSVEHVRPICRGGTTGLENIVPACAACNASKGKRTVKSWLGSKPATDFASRHRAAVAQARRHLKRKRPA